MGRGAAASARCTYQGCRRAKFYRQALRPPTVISEPVIGIEMVAFAPAIRSCKRNMKICVALWRAYGTTTIVQTMYNVSKMESAELRVVVGRNPAMTQATTVVTPE